MSWYGSAFFGKVICSWENLGVLIFTAEVFIATKMRWWILNGLEKMLRFEGNHVDSVSSWTIHWNMSAWRLQLLIQFKYALGMNNFSLYII